jgi:hypothetical protein
VDEEEGPEGIMETARQKLRAEILASISDEIEAVKREVQGDMAA